MQQSMPPVAPFSSGASYGATIFKVGLALPDVPGISSHLVPERSGFFIRYPAGAVIKATQAPIFAFSSFEMAQQFLLAHPHHRGQIWECTSPAGSAAPSRVFPIQEWSFWPMYWEIVGELRWDPAQAWEPSRTFPTEPGSLICWEIRLDRLIDPAFYNPNHIQTYTYRI